MDLITFSPNRIEMANTSLLVVCALALFGYVQVSANCVCGYGDYIHGGYGYPGYGGLGSFYDGFPYGYPNPCGGSIILDHETYNVAVPAFETINEVTVANCVPVYETFVDSVGVNYGYPGYGFPGAGYGMGLGLGYEGVYGSFGYPGFYGAYGYGFPGVAGYGGGCPYLASLYGNGYGGYGGCGGCGCGCGYC